MADWELTCGDCLDVLPGLAAGSVDAVVTDAPYGLEFMGKEWDGGVPGVPYWSAALRVLKPGGYLLAMGGTRTYHRLACAVEDAGFEVRDCLMWVYGSGFPKGRGCLKPAWEPILLCRRPGPKVLPLGIDGCRVPANGDKLGGGGENLKPRPHTAGWDRPWMHNREHTAAHSAKVRANVAKAEELGRYPANVCHDGSGEVLEAFAAFGESKSSGGKTGRVGCGGVYNDGWTGDNPGQNAGGLGDTGTAARFFAECGWSPEEKLFCRAKSIMRVCEPYLANIAGDSLSLSSEHAVSALSGAVTLASQGAIRLSDVRGLSTNVTPSELRQLSETLITVMLSFVSEPSPGLPLEGHFPNGSRVRVAAALGRIDTTTITISRWKSDGSADAVTFEVTPPNVAVGVKDSPSNLRFRYCAKASRAERGEGNTHPTVKPLALMRWLVRLACPAGGLVLDPFAGSGTTGVAALAEGRRFVGVEKDAGYCDIARKRLGGAEVADGLFAAAADNP